MTKNISIVVLLFSICLTSIYAHPPVMPSLDAHTQEFEPKVYKVTDGVYQAVGFALANSIMIEGNDGIIIVDVTESVETARAVFTEFRKITQKPIKAIIYTHNHADHVLGAQGFITKAQAKEIPIYAHETTNAHINRFASIINPIEESRSARMFGTHLPKGQHGFVNGGVGPFLASDSTIGLIRPNTTFNKRLELNIAGIDMVLQHAPGETDDQLFVWLPKKRVLIPGDNIYKAFPNLYTIRGTSYRDPMQWVTSLDEMRALEPEFIAPGHTRPIIGKQKIHEVLTVYRDAIQYVHDQTVRWMNAGLHPDEIVEKVQLPKHLKNHPFLLEHYGTVAWSVRNIYNGYLGWFNGDAASLNPVSRHERAQHTVTLAGGRERVISHVQQAINNKHYAWAAELAGHLIILDKHDQSAKALQAKAFEHLGALSVSPNGRNYYLTQALELQGKIDINADRETTPDRIAFAKDMPISQLLKSLPVNLNAEKALNINQTVALTFTDIEQTYSITIRQGIATLSQGQTQKSDLKVTLSSAAWVDILLGVQSVPAALLKGDIKLENRITGIPAFIKFLMLFKTNES